MAIYLDYAAATPVDDEVLAAMQPFFSSAFHNPSALYGPAVEVSKALEQARADIAAVLGSKSTEIIFTAGGTEANNLALQGIMSQYPGSRIAYSAIEHDSVRHPAQLYNCAEIPVSKDGLVTPEAVSKTVDDNTVLVSIMYANNEIGTIQPLRRISAQLEEIRQERLQAGNELPLFLHADAAQAGNYLDMHVHRLGVDLLTLNGGKLYGPKQSGALYVRTGVALKPLIHGGGQERGLRSGTENVGAAVGLAAALTRSAALRMDESERLGHLQKKFISLISESFPDVIINGSLKYRLPNNIHVTLPGTDNERVLLALDMEGVYAAAGSACSASHDEPSHVLAALGCDKESIRGSLRFSLGRQSSPADVENTIETLRRVLA